MDDELIEHGINTGMAYILRGGRIYGSDVAPAVRRVGYKMAQVGKYGQFISAGYKLGKRILNSFSQKEKEMPPVRRKLSFGRSVPYTTPRKTPSSMRKLNVLIKEMEKMDAKEKKATKGRKRVGALRFKGGKKPFRVMSARTSTLGGKYYKGNRKVAPQAKFERLGTAVNYEYSNTFDTAGNQTMLLTHSNAPASHIARVVVGTMIKTLFKQSGIFITSWWDNMTGVIEVGDKFQIAFVRNAQTNSAEAKEYQVLAADVAGNFSNLVDKVVSLFPIIFNINATGTELATSSVSFKQIAYIPFSVQIPNKRVQLSLAGVKFTLFLKSELKMQNRSLTIETNNEADDIDNVPISGKAYDTKGSGFQFKLARTALGVDSAAGRAYRNVGISNGIRYDSGSSLNGLLEPWQRKQIIGATASQNVALQPGQIKTSILVDTVKVSLDALMKSIYQIQVQTAPGTLEVFPRLYCGHSRLFIWERVIGVTGATGVKIAMEHNGYCAAIMHKPGDIYTMPYFETIA